ncbi:hypothetical protein CAPTEDRAFT_205152 [Capitella teleta]|uniref:Uncharacterized protein n=1 Tax=Capitella teleta TaxID=283909 RepID=R7U0X0_CAPTE|nr:hypothetical protein CAPTEDRAFT_205152 [Capitella teleta]|eukprot:ELT96820.1 hypothetical protein CAPTEDRAFT_205152 [Capitella teleta]
MANAMEPLNLSAPGDLSNAGILEGKPIGTQLGFVPSRSSSNSDKVHQPTAPGEIKRVTGNGEKNSNKCEKTQRKENASDSVSSIYLKKSKSGVKSEIRGSKGLKSDHQNSEDVQPQDSASNIIPLDRNNHAQLDRTHRESFSNKESSFIRAVRKEALKLEGGPSRDGTRSRRKIKKGVFVSYSPDSGFMERKFVMETVKQLKENNLSEDIWFDKDEKNTDSPCWFSLRMEAVERCRGAVLVLSDSYFSCPVSVYEGKALAERIRYDPNSVKLFVVLYAISDEIEIPKIYYHLASHVIDLTKTEHTKKSLAEKTSVVVGSIMIELEHLASIHAPPPPYCPVDHEFTGEYKKKKICQWSVSDLQEWLYKMGIKEFYRQSMAESMVDGFLLMAMTDQDMVTQLGVESRVVRKKIMQQILITLDKEHKLADNWHLRSRTQRPRSNCVYLVYDPADVRLAQSLKLDLTKKGIQGIFFHPCNLYTISIRRDQMQL